MSARYDNDLSDRPIGEPVAFTGTVPPSPVTLTGAHVTVRPLDPDGDAAALFAAGHAEGGDPHLWRYMWEGPYDSLDAHLQDLRSFTAHSDRLYFALVPHAVGTAAGQAAYMRMAPEHGVIEIGHIWLGAELQQTVAATEAIFLLARHVFDDLGYRRLEWKCDALNARSRAAAQRFGFRYEGTFAQHMVVKGRNRDTAWFSITDARWPAVRGAFERWLAPGNFDDHGQQRQALADFLSAEEDRAEARGVA